MNIFISLSDSPKYVTIPYTGTDGFYCSVTPQGTSQRFILNVIDSIQLDEQIDPATLHVTLMYSYQPVPTDKLNPTQSMFKGRIKGITYWKEPKALVLLLDSPDLQVEHTRLQELGAQHTYPDYTPHVTLYTGFLSPKQAKNCLDLNKKFKQTRYWLTFDNQQISNLSD